VKWFPAIVILMFTFTAYAGDGKTHIKRNPLRSDRYQITDSRGKVKGYLKRSVLDPRKVRITDANGKTKGYIKKDTLQPSRTKWGVYNSNGNREATIQQDIFQPQDKYQITTRKGKTGTIKRDILNRNTWVIEP